MRFLIVDEDDIPYMLLLPAKETREEAEIEIKRMNEVVKNNNKKYEEVKSLPYEKGDCFRYKKDTRQFFIREIE